MIRLFVLIFLLVPQFSWGQSSLPPCPETGVRHNCFGSLVNATGGKYVGEYQNGLRHGNGVYYYGDGTILLSGRWMDDVLKQNYKLDAAMFPFDLQNSGPTQGASAGVGGQGNFLDAGYLMRLRKAILDNTVFNEAVRGNPRAEFTVSLSGSCEVLQVRLNSSSGDLSWDEAARQAISRTNPFPKPPSGTCPPKIAISHQPKDSSNSNQTYASAANISEEEKKLAERLRADQIARMKQGGYPRTSDDSNKIAAELEAERKKRQELEERLAAESKERERLAQEAKDREKQLAESKERERLIAEAKEREQRGPSPPAQVALPKNPHALIIGNAAYPGSSRLDNPINDAKAIEQKLKSMGFTVTVVTDANRQRLVQAMSQFRKTASNADLSLLFYSGHGVQIFGTNYILPIDVDQTDVAQATIQGVSLNSVIENFLPGKTKIVFLDACRDNPLQRSSDRSVSKGLAPISVAQGTLIAYATKDGQTASDGVGQKNSPFTKALLEHLSDPQDIAVILRKVREKVMTATGGKQQPWEYGSLTGGELVLSGVKR